MELQTLYYFKEIASGKTYLEVADEHHISQSSLSKTIIRLEDELGVSLFDRKKRCVALTPAGQCLYEAVQNFEPVIRETMKKIRALAAVEEVRIGIVPNVDYMNLEFRIPASTFTRENPNIRMELYTESYLDESIEMLQRDELDILVAKLFQITKDYCDCEEISDDPMYLVIRNDHPLANRASVDFAELYHEHVLTRSFVVRRAIQEACNHLGLEMMPNLEFFKTKLGQMNRMKIINMVSMGHGVTIMVPKSRPLIEKRS